MVKLSCFRKKKSTLAVIRLSGVIGGEGAWKKGLCLDDIEDDIKRAFNKKRYKAVVLQINSPGGSPVQTERIYYYLRMLSEDKQLPIYSFVEDVAASGGYWLACAGDEIYASTSSIVGSIGVISSGFGFVEALKKLGIERRVYTQGENKSILDPFSKEKKSDVDILLNMQKDVHDAFKDIVRDRREGKIKKTHEKQLFSGEFWNGKKAVDMGLIDGTGDIYHMMRERFGKDVAFEKILKPKSWIKRKLGIAMHDAIDSVVSIVSERDMWQRFGR